MTDGRIAVDLAAAAGTVLREIQLGSTPASLGTSALKDRGDSAAQRELARLLAQLVPEDAVLSEEASDDLTRLSADRVWIIDPLDGTREFSEGRNDWAVHVALWEHGELTAGAVALPGISKLLSTLDPKQSWALPGRPRIAVSRSRPTPLAERLADALDAELVPMGSAGYKVGAVVRGEVDMYVHSGGQYEWDSAAPVAVARAAGLFTARLDGSPLEYNRPDPYLPDLIVCNPLMASGLLELLDSLLKGLAE